MAKVQSTFLNMVLALFIVALVSSGLLGGVFLLTKDAIAEAKLEGKLTALRSVLPEFDNDPYEERYTVKLDRGELTFYPAMKNGQKVGTAVETFTDQGYGGRIDIMVGFLLDGSIFDSVVTEHKETPGLGAKLDRSQSDFPLQFKGKDPKVFRLMVKKDGGDVDAITAATISSRGYCDALSAAYQALMNDPKAGVR